MESHGSLTGQKCTKPVSNRVKETLDCITVVCPSHARAFEPSRSSQEAGSLSRRTQSRNSRRQEIGENAITTVLHSKKTEKNTDKLREVYEILN